MFQIITFAAMVGNGKTYVLGVRLSFIFILGQNVSGNCVQVVKGNCEQTCHLRILSFQPCHTTTSLG